MTPSLVDRVPGPRGRRVGGNLPEFAEDPLAFLLACHARFGDVVRLGRRNVLVAHPRLVGEVLSNRSGAYPKLGGVSSAARTRGSGFPRAMMNSEGRDWEEKRRRLAPVFARPQVTAFGPTIVERTRAAVEGWADGSERDVRRGAAELALGLIVSFLFGRETARGADAVGPAVDAVMDLTASPLELPRWLPTPTNVRLRLANRALARYIADLTEAPDAPATEFVRALAARRADGAYVHDEVATLLMSGHETTADALAWLWHLLARSPETQSAIAEEANDAALARCVATGDVAQLPLASAAAREALRLYPPAWITNRELADDVVLGSYPLPRGTTIAVSQWVSHRDPRFFAEAGSFRPERWLDGREAPPRFAFFPFGGGPRVCIGARLALYELVLISAVTARTAEIDAVADRDPRPRPALALQPAGLRLRFRPRAGHRPGLG